MKEGMEEECGEKVFEFAMADKEGGRAGFRGETGVSCGSWCEGDNEGFQESR